MSIGKWFGFALIGKTLDLLTTFYLVNLHGIGVESNPLTANMLSAYGIVPGLIVNGSIYSLLVLILFFYKRKKLLMVAAVLTFLLPVVNSIAIIFA